MNITCPKCKNDDPSMLDTYGHRREQVSVNCKNCAHSFIHVFTEVPKEVLIKSVPPINEWK